MTWFIMDGGDQADPLTCLDRAGAINDQVTSLQNDVPHTLDKFPP